MIKYHILKSSQAFHKVQSDELSALKHRHEEEAAALTKKLSKEEEEEEKKLEAKLKAEREARLKEKRERQEVSTTPLN